MNTKFLTILLIPACIVLPALVLPPIIHMVVLQTALAVLFRMSVKWKEYKNTVQTIAILILTVMAIDALIMVAAIRHGADLKTICTKSTKTLQETNQESVPVKKDRTPAPGQTVLYTRYGCDDCAAVLPELYDYLKKETDFFGTVDARTEFGQSLLEKYPVERVPMILYILDNQRASSFDPYLDGSWNETGTREFIRMQNVS